MKGFKLADRSNREDDSLLITIRYPPGVEVKGKKSASFSVVNKDLTPDELRDLIMKGEFKIV